MVPLTLKARKMASNQGEPSSKTFANAFDRARKRKRDEAATVASSGNDESKKPPRKKKQRPPKRKGVGVDTKAKSPSREALELSSQLKECSRNKDLKRALSLFWDSRHEKVRDQVHASIAVDCCARCGELQEIERILESVKGAVSVETNILFLNKPSRVLKIVWKKPFFSSGGFTL